MAANPLDEIPPLVFTIAELRVIRELIVTSQTVPLHMLNDACEVVRKIDTLASPWIPR